MRAILLFILTFVCLHSYSQKFKTSYLQGNDTYGVMPLAWDFDNDDDQDLIISQRGGRIRSFENLGDGNFQEVDIAIDPFKNIWVVNVSELFPAIGDITGDGTMDLIIAYNEKINGNWANQVCRFKHYELIDGFFQEKPNSILVSKIQALALPKNQYITLEDWDGDDNLDLILSSDQGQVSMFQYLNAEFQYPDQNDPFKDVKTPQVTTNSQVIFVNPDEDQDRDILLIEGGSLRSHYFENEGGTFTLLSDDQNPYAAITGSAKYLAYGDLTGDDMADMWVMNRNGVGVLFAHTPTGFVKSGNAQNPFSELGSTVNSFIHVGPVLSNELEMYALKQGKILRFNESGELVEGPSPFDGIEEINSFCFYDWDNDQDMDLFVGKSKNTDEGYKNGLDYYQNNDGQFTLIEDASSPVSHIFVDYWIAPTFADFNGDTLTDVLIGYSINTPSTDTPALLYYQNNGSGELVRDTTLFDFATVAAMGNNMRTTPHATDLNNDGKIDVVVGGPNLNGLGGAMRVILNNGNNTYRLLNSYEGVFDRYLWFNERFRASSYDIDQDGDQDLFASATHGGVLMLENVSAAYIPSINDQVVYDSEIFSFDTTTLGTSDSIEIKLRGLFPEFDVNGYEFFKMQGNDGEMSVSRIERNENHISVWVKYTPQMANQPASFVLSLMTNDDNVPVHTVQLQGVGKGPRLYLYEEISANSYRPIGNGGYFYSQEKTTAGNEIICDIRIANLGNDTLTIDTSSLVLPEGVILSNETPLPVNPPISTGWDNKAILLRFLVTPKAEEPYLSEAVSFRTNDPTADPFTFHFLFTDIAGISSPASLYVPSVLVDKNAAPFDLQVYTNSSKTTTIEIQEGEDLIQLNNTQVTLNGQTGMSKLKISVSDDPATETLQNEKVFFITIVEDATASQTQVIDFPDVIVPVSIGSFLLQSSSNATQVISLRYEVISGDDVVELDPHFGNKVYVKKSGTAEIKATYGALAPFEAEASKTMTLTVDENVGFGAPEYTSLRLIPNPATHSTFIDTDSEILMVQVFDFSGRLIQTGNSSQLNLSDYDQGMYIIRVMTPQGNFESTLLKQ